MTNRMGVFLLIIAMMITMLTGCASQEEDFDVGGDIDINNTDKDDSSSKPNEKDETPSDSDPKDPSKPDEKDETPSDSDPDKKPSDDEPDDKTPNNNKEEANKPTPDGGQENPSTGTVIATLTKLQTAGKAFDVAAGETVWFGPMPITAEEVATFGGSGVNKSAVTEVYKFGGGYRLYSYKATSAGSMTVKAPDGYAEKFLISKGQEMTETEYYYHFDQKNGVNLYDGALDSTGKTIDWAGKEKTSSAQHLSHAIVVNKGDTLTFGPASSAQVVQAFGYDAKGKATTLINGGILKEEGTFEKGLKIYTYTVPEGVSSIRLVVDNELKTKFAATKNKAFNTAEYETLTGEKGSSLIDPLKKKTALFVGDSICEGWKNGITGIPRFPDAYSGLIAKETGIEATNAGVGSSTISNEKPVYKQFETLKNNDYDYVVIQGGINDMSHNRKVGSMSDSYDIDEFEISTYAGGLEYTIYKAIEYYGDTAAIAYIFTPAFPNHPSGNYGNLPQYLEVAKEICEKWGILFFDMNEIDELIQRMDVNNKTYTGDFIHMNGEGYKMVVPYIIEMMRSLTPCKPATYEKVQPQ